MLDIMYHASIRGWYLFDTPKRLMRRMLVIRYNGIDLTPQMAHRPSLQIFPKATNIFNLLRINCNKQFDKLFLVISLDGN